MNKTLAAQTSEISETPNDSLRSPNDSYPQSPIPQALALKARRSPAYLLEAGLRCDILSPFGNISPDFGTPHIFEAMNPKCREKALYCTILHYCPG